MKICSSLWLKLKLWFDYIEGCIFYFDTIVFLLFIFCGVFCWFYRIAKMLVQGYFEECKRVQGLASNYWMYLVLSQFISVVFLWLWWYILLYVFPLLNFVELIVLWLKNMFLSLIKWMNRKQKKTNENDCGSNIDICYACLCLIGIIVMKKITQWWTRSDMNGDIR